jgi:putative membrane protein
MRYAILAVAVLLFASPVYAQSSKTSRFVQNAAASDMFELDSSKLALTKSKNAKVRGFAQMMVSDHQKTSDELKSRLPSSVKLPSGMGVANRAKLARLRLTPEGSFDRAYANYQVEAHKQAVSLFEDYAKNGDTTDLKQWAASKLPTLKEHLSMATQLDASSEKKDKK